ncbi:malic protein NAD-binding protein [Thermaerobacter marianensis DSM 12885]|uniref:Malic protein NAD-binding protein n=1 Tax=Thermaerobacter marianensis (strain ATCC 700841 / DSM 12885 / JCM 10246 / 7p75a) TaxID=644966 RepID=E6SLT1_THEM7|nr:malic protein NAD-binding protein [Thermaerobacter marianensis DSM 12885]
MAGPAPYEDARQPERPGGGAPGAGVGGPGTLQSRAPGGDVLRDDALRAAAVTLHRQARGKIEIASKVPLRDHRDLSLAYTPGVAEPCRLIAADPDEAFELTTRGNLVAVVSDGSAVLGLGDIGPEAALPVMEGKAILFKLYAAVDAVPLCVRAREVGRLVEIVAALAPSFGGINLEDVAAPRCFEVEARLRAELDIPVFHDDQHGTAIVTAAALTNALRVVGKELDRVRIVVNGAGAAGIATSHLLLDMGARDLVLCDSRGAIYPGRPYGMNPFKQRVAERSNPAGLKGQLADVMEGADVFIGLSRAGAVTPAMVRSMAPDAIVMAMANPTPEIFPDEAAAAGARVVCTGRSDFPNQINNVLAFPGVFRGALDVRAREINEAMKLAAARAIADLVEPDRLSPDYIIPEAGDPRVAPAVAAAVAAAAVASGVARRPRDPAEVGRETARRVEAVRARLAGSSNTLPAR